MQDNVITFIFPKHHFTMAFILSLRNLQKHFQLLFKNLNSDSSQVFTMCQVFGVHYFT